MQANTQGWHTEKWGMWGWIETGLKLVAIGIGLLALVRSFPPDYVSLGNHPHLIGLIVLVVLTLAALAQMAIRFGQRETISMIFAVVNFLGHVALLVAVLQNPFHNTLPLAFGVFYILGQLTKIQFLRTSGYTEGGATSSNMVRVTGAVLIAYAVFTVLMLL